MIFLGFFQSIKLENYRNFNYFEADFKSGCNILIGKNGSGKTNILESISLFERGRGLRKDNINNLVNHKKVKKILILHLFFFMIKRQLIYVYLIKLTQLTRKKNYLLTITLHVNQ